MKELNDIFAEIIKNYSVCHAFIIEKLVRYESAHFQSKEWLACFSPGMVALTDSYPYGWSSLDNGLWSKSPQLRPKGIVAMKGTKYLAFTDARSGILSCAEFLKMRNYGAWNSLQPAREVLYENQLIAIKSPIVESLCSTS